MENITGTTSSLVQSKIAHLHSFPGMQKNNKLTGKHHSCTYKHHFNYKTFHLVKDAPKSLLLQGWGYLKGLFNLKQFRELIPHLSLKKKKTLTENCQSSLQLMCVCVFECTVVCTCAHTHVQVRQERQDGPSWVDKSMQLFNLIPIYGTENFVSPKPPQPSKPRLNSAISRSLTLWEPTCCSSISI